MIIYNLVMEASVKTIIANTLSNIYDWKSDDLKTDFVTFINSECEIDSVKLSKLFDRYNALSPRIRDDISFDLKNFIKKELN